MESHQDHHEDPTSGNTSGERSSSPADNHDNPEFEFGSITPTSPSKDPYSNNSPADHLFLNGRLLPHAFPSSQPTVPLKSNNKTNILKSPSIRSNSINSSSSSSISHTPRTSSSSSNNSFGSSSSFGSGSSTNSSSIDEKRNLYRCNSNSGNIAYASSSKKRATEMVTAQLYGSYSRRWQYITPVPGAVFKREGSVKRTGGGGGGGGGGSNINGSKNVNGYTRSKRRGDERRNSNCNKVVRWWRRLIRAALMACQECHAMEPSRSRDDVVVQRKSVVAS